MALDEYHRKRHFGRTAEPAGAQAERACQRYVVHKHDARRLHYDLRLEHEGVLLSWAVPKGPSLDPETKRLAVQVEEHPVEYGDFEGLIPEGQYGAGPSALWDRGYWEPVGDVDEGLERGSLHFRLHGERLEGGWHLVRSGGKKNLGKQWLLIKERDAAADPDIDPTAAGPDSIVTGRSLDEIRTEFEPPQVLARPPRAATLPGARAAPLLESPRPQLATLVKNVPTGEQWLYEIKYDGYRMLCRLEGGRARIVSRNGRDWSEPLSALAIAAAALPVESAVLDGEVVIVRADGSSDFQALQNYLADGRADGVLAYYLFDLPYLDGHDLSRTPLLERKQALRALLADADASLRYSDHVVGKGELMYQEACRLSLEGVISKRVDSDYLPSRTRSWTKTKCVRRGEFVIGGFTERQGDATGFGALLLGYYEGGALRYAGKVGTGFNRDALARLSPRLQALERLTPPFVDSPAASKLKTAHWVSPELVAEVSFADWTDEGRLRHASYLGLREDKPAREVVREREAAPSAAVQLSNPERLLWPEAGVSKRDLADYYAAVAERILPHLVGRPLSLLRCPEGHDKPCFFQRHLGEGEAPAVHRGGADKERYVYSDDLAGLISLVQLGGLELHPWGSLAETIERPDRLVLDLDPGPDVGWGEVCDAAREVRERLRALGLESFLKATGGKGLHVVLPLQPALDWDAHKAFAKSLAEAMARDQPRRYTANMAKTHRHGRIFVDYLRNGRGATAIAPWSTRARVGAPVAMPLRWDELDGLAGADLYSLANTPHRLAALRADPWQGFFELRQRLTAKMQRQLVAKPACRR